MSQTNNITKGINPEEFKKNINEKVCLLLKLFKKYAKKFNELLPLCELSLTNKTAISLDVLNELKETVEQYSNAINNEKLIKIFNFQNESINKEDQIDFSDLEPQSINILGKYELEMKKLQKENENLMQKVLLFDQKEKDESSLLKTKLKKIQIEKDELEDKISELHKKNKELTLKYDTLKENQKKLKNQEEIIEQLNKKIETLEIDLKYKDKTISYMESLLQKINIQQNGENITNNSINKVSNSFSVQKKFDNSNRYDINENENYNCNYKSNDIYNNPNYESKVISGSKILFEHEQKEKEALNIQEKENKNNINNINNIEEELKKDGMFQSQEINEINLKNNKEATQSGILQNEIDVLDKEIISLKSKLKMMIEKK